MSYPHRSRRVSSFQRPKYRTQKSKKPSRFQYIDPRRFVAVATASTQEAYKATHSFSDFALDSRLQKNLAAKGYVTPSPIQDQAIPFGLQGRDIIGIANTGTGKTAAFALPIINKLINDNKAAAIVIAPTRELAQQTEDECRQLASGAGLTTAILIGGVGMGNQLHALRRNPRIVVGTPGRIKDHMQRGSLKLDRFNVVVLDEVDRMLDMGFVHDVTHILSKVNGQRQSFFFSATIDPKVRTLIDTFTTDAATIIINTSSASESVHQDVVRYSSSSEKLDKLHDILIDGDAKKVIIFDETQRRVERLKVSLVERGFAANAIHGGKTQGQRQRALASFKNSEANILVATDVAARGIDVADVTHVVNYSIPKQYDDYIHRIGRAGRAGKTGYALTFVETADRKNSGTL